ncbi:MAG TPA: hypothetical protein VNZ52_15995 [Candidatus Thermoplasmatota archaeon]|nr:hypothetical protein [Candidatus Thermoplasmatota archaeon]
MTRTKTAFALVAMVALLAPIAAPMAAAQEPAPAAAPAPVGPGRVVTFYGHVFGTGLDAPMPANTQLPIGEENYGLGTFAYCTPAGNFEELVPTPTGETGCDDDDNNKLVFFSSPGFVDVTNSVEFTTRGGYGLLHNERGQTKDIYLDTSGTVEGVIYMTLDFHSWVANNGETGCPSVAPPRDVGCPYPYWGWDPGAYPDYTVKATLYSANLEGDHGSNASEAPPIKAAIDAGTAIKIAEGESTPTTVQNGLPGTPEANEFRVNLGSPLVDKIPRDHSFFMVFSWYSRAGGQQFTTAQWRIWSGEYYPHRFTLPIKNAFEIEQMTAAFVFGKLLVSGSINTPWGSYDINPKATTLTVANKAGVPVDPRSIEAFTDVSVAHGGHYAPANASYVWDYRADKAAPGEYTATLRAANWQGSVTAECKVTFIIGEKEADNRGGNAVCGGLTTNLGSGGNDPNSRLPEGTGRADTPDRRGDTRLPVLGVRSAALAPAGLDLTLLAGAALAGLALVASRRWLQ